jgi:hypothetical protein
MAMPPRRNPRLLVIPVVLILGHIPAVLAETPPYAAGAQETDDQARIPANPAEKLTYAYGIDAGVGETDNVTLVSTDKISETIAVADADFSLKQQSRLLNAEAKGSFSYLDFLQGTYSHELIGRLDGLARFALIPEKISWVLQEDFGQAQVDPFTPVTPTNRENVNYVSTGPDLDLRLGSLGFVDVTARYARTQYQTSPFDSNRFTGSIAVGRALSAGSTIALAGSTERVLFANTVENTDFDRSSIYGRYEAQGARTELRVNLGATKVDQGNESITGPFVKLQLSRKISSAANLTFTAGRNLIDAATAFSALQGGAIGAIGATAVSGIGTSPAAVTSSNYTVTYASVGWQYARNRTTFGVSGQWEKDSYQGQPQLDLNRGSGQLSVERQLTRAFTAQLIGSVYRTNYANVDFAETDGLAGAVLTFREGRGLEIRLRCEHVSRVVSGIGSGYTENRAFLTVGYRPRKPVSG